jgi:hypothetical protein
MIQEINEPVEVIAVYQKGKVQPLRIRWGQTVYQVKKINNTWRQKTGNVYHSYFSVETKSNTSMILAVDPADMSWRLASINVEG